MIRRPFFSDCGFPPWSYYYPPTLPHHTGSTGNYKQGLPQFHRTESARVRIQAGVGAWPAPGACGRPLVVDSPASMGSCANAAHMAAAAATADPDLIIGARVRFPRGGGRQRLDELEHHDEVAARDLHGTGPPALPTVCLLDGGLQKIRGGATYTCRDCAP